MGGLNGKFFDKLDEILVARPATHSPVLLETLKLATMEFDCDVTDAEGQDDNDSSLVDLHSQVDGTTHNAGSEHMSGSCTDSLSGTPSYDHGIRDDTEDIAKNNKSGKKCKRTQGDMLEGPMTKAKKVMIDGLRDSDRMFAELEEKRLKFEEQLRREEYKFQLRMMQMLQGVMGSSSFYSPYSHGSSSQHYGPPDDC